MPFTLAHPAAALPFRRLNLVWSAFVIGSMAPDFPYITGSAAYRLLGHGFPAVVWFTLPAAFAALWLFHNVFKRPVIELCPVALQQRLGALNGDFRFGGTSRFLAILVSIVLGIVTHLVWDAFTHSYTWPWYHIVWLQGWGWLPGLGPTPRYWALQIGSSIAGLLVLAVWGVWWYFTTSVSDRQPQAPPKSRFSLAVIMFAIASMAGFLKARAVVGAPTSFLHLDKFLLVFGLTALALAFWQVLLYCLLVSSHQVWTLN